MFTEVLIGTLFNATPFVAAWTALSFSVAAAWCVYRSPGREQRLALEAATNEVV